MHRRNKGIVAFTLLILLELCLIMHTVTFASESNDNMVGRVLFISSYSYAWETVPEQIAGIQEALPDTVTIDYKFMDTKNVNNIESQELFFESLKVFLNSVVPYDVVIVGDDDAFNFAMNYQEELFKNTPIIFEGVNNVENAIAAKESGRATGVIESLSYRNTILLAQKLYPKASKIVAILDDTVTGEAERNEYYETAKRFPNLQFEEIDTSACSGNEIIQKVTELDDSTILLFIMCTEDGEGKIYTSTESVKMISQAAKIPTFSIVSTGMGYGILGGEIVSQREMGYEAAKMAQKILNGEKIDDISIVRNSPKTYRFDAEKMRQFDISEKQLPKDVEITNQQDTFWNRNSEAIEAIIWITLILSVLLVIMIYDNIRRRRVNGTLERMKDTLEEASRYDVLTGILNRRMFMEEMERKVACHDSFGILMMDLDNFKHINDTLGHNNGDIVLKEWADRLMVLSDENFSAYRLAGDEFTAIIDSKNADVVEAYAKEIQFSFHKPYTLEKKKYLLHSSIGIALYPKDGKTVSELINSADAAMYKVKNNGKGGIAFYDSSCNQEIIINKEK